MSNKVKVSVIVLNWNGRRFLEACLESLLGQSFRDFEIVLVDNGSTDGSVDFIKERYAANLALESQPCLRLVALPKNTGFAGGNLAGLPACNVEAEYIVTLNNDTCTAADWLEKLVIAMDSQPQTEYWGAACGPMLFQSSQHDQPIIAAAGIAVYRNGLAMDGQVGQLYQPDEKVREVFGPCAGAALYRREALAEVGFFDKAFFAYLEDADLAWRLRLNGWRTLYVPMAKVWHAYSGTGGQGSPFKNYQLGRNRVWVLLKNWPASLWLRYLPQVLLYDLAASLYTIAQRNPQPIKGRLAALHPRYLKRIWSQRRAIQQSRAVSLAEIERWLQPSPSLTSNLHLRKRVNTLVSSQPEKVEI